MTKLARLVLMVTLILLCVSPVMAKDSFFREIGICAFANQSMDLDQELNTAGINLALVAPLSDGPRVRLDFRLEGQQGFFWGYDRGVEIAAAPSLRAYFKWWSVRPYVECGLGLSYQSLDIYELGTDFNFLSFAGLGFSLPIGDAFRLQMGYRLRHISNAGLDERNHGVTANQIQLEVSWAF